ncbi:MAG: hypothetical protein ACTSRG_09795 [Candidatus Helarchaeota archaeon]
MMKIDFNKKVYFFTIIYEICAIPIYFILFKVPIPNIQPWMVFIYPFILPICLIMRKKIKEKIIDCDKTLIKLVENKKLKELYVKDTQEWIEKTFKQKRDKITSILLLTSFLIVPILISFAIFGNIKIDLTPYELIYLICYGCSLIIIMIYAAFNFFLLIQVSSIVHHFSFWEIKGDPEQNNLGELIILNVFTFTCLYVVSLNYLTPLFICLIVYTVSGVNPKINYIRNVGKEYLKYKNLTPFLIIFANLLYILKWVHGSYSNIDIALFIAGFFVFFIIRKYLNDVLNAKYSDYENAKTNFLETFAHEKIQIPYYLAITGLSMMPFIFSILTTSLWDWKFTLFIIYTIFSIFSAYIGISFLRYEKNKTIFIHFRKIFFSSIIVNSLIPLGFYIIDTIISFSDIQTLLLVLIIFLTVINLLFGIRFYYKGIVGNKFRIFFFFSIIGDSLVPFFNSILDFIFTQPVILLFWQLWETLLITAIGIIVMFLGIHFLRKETRKNVDRFLPYIPEHKIEETNFHFWATFNSNHAFYFSILFGFTFFFMTYWWNVIGLFEIPIYFNTERLLTINLFGNQTMHQIVWILGNYISLYIYGVGFGFLDWLLFQATHDVWHSITLSEGVPEEVQEDLYSSRMIITQGALIVLLICGSAAIWYVGDSLIKTSYFQVLFRFSNLLIMGLITFLGIIYIIRNEINRKKR